MSEHADGSVSTEFGKESLSLRGVDVSFGDARAVSDISFDIAPGQIVGIVGESGCGKSTLLRAVMGLPVEDARVSAGSIVLGTEDLVVASEERLCELRGSEIALILQDPDASLCPTRKIKHQLRDTVASHGIADMRGAERELLRIFENLRLEDGKRVMNSYPFELSGGMRQRVAIAFAMLLRPRFLLADEPTSALDVATQAQVVDEMMQLAKTFGTGVLVVTHNLGVVARMADALGVMYAGQLVEFGPVDAVLDRPLHPYTRCLLASIPKVGGEMPAAIPGIPPLLAEPFDLCRFMPRCPQASGCGCAVDAGVGCRVEDGTHWTLCGRGAA